MKFAVCVLLLCCLAMAFAAPQLLTTWPGFAGLYTHGLYTPGTVVAGPTVVNGLNGVASAGRIITPGVITPTFY